MTKTTKTIIWLTFILIVFGLVMLSSAGVYLSQKKFNTSYYYLNHQIIFGFLPGLFLFLLASKTNYRFWKKISVPLMLASVVLLFLVFIPNFSYSFQGAKRWINLGVFSFQPSEILKLTLIIYLASWFSSRFSRLQKEKFNKSSSVLTFLTILIFIGFFLALQPDIGTLGVIVAIALLMFFVSGVKLKHFFGVLLIIAVLAVFLINLAPYRLNRLMVFLNQGYDSRGAGYHLNQSLISIGSGGLFGLGFGKSEQKLGFLPEPVGDSIFSLIVEELGFLGAVFLIGLLLALIVFLIILSKKTKDDFARLFVSGMVGWIGVQSFVNIASLTGMIPMTGIPLPFISFGGTSLAILMAGMGIVVNISKRKK